jgi:hypothetical protein
MPGRFSRLFATTPAVPVVFVARGDGGADAIVAALQAREARVEESGVGRPYFTYADVGRQIDRSDAVVVPMRASSGATSTLYELRLAVGLEDRLGRDPRPTFIYGRPSDELDVQLRFSVGEEKLPTYLPEDLDAAVDVVLAAASRSTA